MENTGYDVAGYKMTKDEHFNSIKEVYDSFYRYLFVKHSMYPVKETGKGFWGVSVSDEVFKLFSDMGLHKYKHFLDLGSGDGKVVMIASLFTNATGVEYDPWLHDVANDVKDKLFHVPHVNRVNLVNDDFFDHDFSYYDIIFMNPDSVDPRLYSKIRSEFEGDLVVYGTYSNPPFLDPHNSFEIDGTNVNLFKIKRSW